MSRFWKLTPVAAVFALGLLAFAPGGASQPSAVSAAECGAGKTGTLRVDIIDDNTGNRITVPGTIVRFNPDTKDFDGTNNVTDNSSEDNSSIVGRIQQNNACSTGTGESYTVRLVLLPSPLDECDIVDEEDTGTVSASSTTTLELVIDCEGVSLATPTPTVGAARTVTVQSSNASLGCNNTSIITIVVKDGAGNPVQSGTLVNIVTNLGTVSPTSGQTTADGSVFVFYTAPGNQGGVATITATAGTASGSTQVAITCSAAPTATTAPPPTVPSQQTGGSITPPSTGDGGLRDATGWQTYAGLALTALAALSAAVLLRRRA